MGDNKIRFGPFDLDTRAGELSRDGRRLRLQEKPFKLLLALLERPGEIVTRKELRARLWPANTVVEFDDGLNTAVNKLRTALGESAGAPTYVETVGRRGYRFLGRITQDPDDVPRGTVARRQVRVRWVAAGLALASAAALVGAWLIAGLPFGSDPPEVARFSVVLPRAQILEAQVYQSVAVSPQGTHFAYAADGRIYLRPVDAAAARAVPGTEDQGRLSGVLFSPDGEWLAFHAWGDRELRKVPVAGGTPLRLATVDGYLGGSWGADGRIVFAQEDGVYAVPGAGGEPVLLASVDPARGERAQNPMALPRGRGILFTLVTTTADGAVTPSIVVEQPGAEQRRAVVERGHDARYLATGHLIFADDSTLLVAPFDLDTLQITGTALPVSRRLARQPVRGGADFAVARNGTLIYREEHRPMYRLVWANRTGHRQPLGLPPRGYGYVRLSPDGTKIAAQDEWDIYVWDIARAASMRLTFNPERNYQPIWTPDGKRVVFASFVDGQGGIAWKAADGSGAVERLRDGGGDTLNPNSISPDGAQLIFRQITPKPENRLWLLPLEDPASAQPLALADADPFNGEVSPDGRWLAYQSNDSGIFEVYIRPFPGLKGGRWQVSSGGGTQPAWSPDGRELFYIDSGRLLGVTVDAGEAPSVGPTRVVLDGLPFPIQVVSGRFYDISPDGQRFLIREPVVQATDDPLAGLTRYEVVLSWSEELRQLAAN